MPRPEEGDWGNFALLPRNVALLTTDSPLKCVCPDYPCTEQTCLRDGIADTCPACAKHGHALFTRAEMRWVETGEGLTEAEVVALRNLWGRHENHNSRLVRNGDPAYGAGVKPSEPVAEAC